MIRPITLPCDYKAYVTYYPKKLSLALPRGVRYVEFAGAGRYKAALRHLVKIMEEINGQN